jgi:hypothetical protein
METNVVKNIYQRLASCMAEVEYVQKEDRKVNNQYTFVSHDAVTAKVRKAFVNHGIVSVPRVIKHYSEGNRTTVDIEVDFVNIDEPEDKITVPCFGYGIDPQDKGPGKAMSYAVKYAYLKVLALETGDDPERDNIDHDIREDELSELLTYMKDSGSLDELKTRFSEVYMDVRKRFPKSKHLTKIEAYKEVRKKELQEKMELAS